MAGSSTAATPTFVLTPTATATEVEEAVEHALSTSSFDQTIGANAQEIAQEKAEALQINTLF